MTTTITTPTSEPPPEVASPLQSLLAALLALRLMAKQAHWNVRGAHFRDIHLELDEVVDELDGWIDETAERLVAIGEPADGRAVTIAAAGVPAPPEGFVGDLDATGLLGRAIAVVIASARRSLPSLEADLVTQDVVIGILHGLEKRQWMLRSRVA